MQLALCEESMRESITKMHAENRERVLRSHGWLDTALVAAKQGSIMMKRAYSTEHSGSNSSGESSVSRGTVMNRMSLLTDSAPRHFETRVSLPAAKVKDADGPIGREADRYIFGNALRGWAYALLPSLVLWTMLVGLIYSLVKR